MQKLDLQGGGTSFFPWCMYVYVQLDHQSVLLSRKWQSNIHRRHPKKVHVMASIFDTNTKNETQSATTDVPLREVVHGDAFTWLAERDTLGNGVCVVTSLPDRSELAGVPEPKPCTNTGSKDIDEATASSPKGILGSGSASVPGESSGPDRALANRGQLMSVEAYGRWLANTTALIVAKLEGGCAAVFYQTDTRSTEDGYIDKSYFVTQGALAAGGTILFHKIVLRSPPDNPTTGLNPAFTHLLAFGSPRGCPALSPDGPGARSCPDVCSKGTADWPKGTGPLAASHAVKYLRDGLKCETILDPFCGTGCVLAVAEFYGCRAAGVELHKGRARAANRLQVVKPKGGGLKLVRPVEPKIS